MDIALAVVLLVGMLPWVSYIGCKATVVHRAGKRLTMWENGALFVAFATSQLLIAGVGSWAKGDRLAALSFGGVFVPTLAAAVGRTARPYQIATLGALVYVETIALAASSWKYSMEDLYVFMVGLYGLSLLFVMPLERSARI